MEKETVPPEVERKIKDIEVERVLLDFQEQEIKRRRDELDQYEQLLKQPRM